MKAGANTNPANTAPSALSQEHLEREVYDTFQIDPEDIRLMEAHGTGTRLGDPIEWRALSNAFRRYTQDKQFCAIGSIKTGIRHAEVFPGKLNAPPHCHAAEEEIFVVLDGDGQVLLWEEGGVEEHELRTGSIVCRPAGTGVAHAFRGGDDGMTLLMYGTRDTREVCYYPRSGNVFFVGLGLIARLGEQVDYWDGED